MTLKPSHTLKIASLALVGILALSGCSNNDSETTTPNGTTNQGTPAGQPTFEPGTPTESDVAAVESVTVTGPVGSEPAVEFETPFVVASQTSRLLADGTGAALQDGQSVTINISAWRGDTGELLFSSWVDDSPESFVMGSGELQPISDMLQGAHVGARGLLANPVAMQGDFFTVLSVFEVIGAVDVLDRAVGEAVTVDPGAGLPVVTLAANGEPSIEIPAGYQPPDHLVVQPLIVGDGPVVAPDSFLTVHYTGWMVNGEQFDSSWARNAPAGFPLTGVIEGWQEGLAGQTVGSQVLLVIPPDMAYRDQQQGPIPPNSTLIFVVDILNIR